MSNICTFCEQNRNCPLKKLETHLLDFLNLCIPQQSTKHVDVCYLCHEGLTVAYNFKCRYEIVYASSYKSGAIDSKECGSPEFTSDEEDFAGFEPHELNNQNADASKWKLTEKTKPFVCNACCRSFRSKENIGVHVLRHATKHRQVRCRECGSKFLCLSHYKQHACEEQ